VTTTRHPTGQDLAQVDEPPVAFHVAAAAKWNDILRSIVQGVIIFMVKVESRLAAILAGAVSPFSINRTCARAPRVFVGERVALPVGIEGAEFDFVGAASIFRTPSSLKFTTAIFRDELACQSREPH